MQIQEFTYLVPVNTITGKRGSRTNVTGRSARFIRREIVTQLSNMSEPAAWRFEVEIDRK